MALCEKIVRGGDGRDTLTIYAYNAKNEKYLGIDVVVENTSTEELIVSDVERGLLWFVRPSVFGFTLCVDGIMNCYEPCKNSCSKSKYSLSISVSSVGLS